MQYPLISEYVRAIQDASNNLDELGHLEPVLDDHGEPYRSSGAFAVVFKMKDEQTGKCYALKCFTEEQEGRAEAYRQIADELEFVDSSYITSVKYLDKEIFVDSSCEEDEFPVLLMDWIDGETMESYIAENYQDNYAMAMLCYRFCKMAAWLRSQPFAHGDIKPDNIMVRPDGSLTLIDYDGMFVPAMKGQKSPTIGTKDFSHPLRTVDDFDETIDDFALASIALSLKAISLKPSLLDESGVADRLLFSADDYRDLSNSNVVVSLSELLGDTDLRLLYSLFNIAFVKKNLSFVSFRMFNIALPDNCWQEKNRFDDLKQVFIDEFGVKYGRNGLILIRAPKDISGTYRIRKECRFINTKAFKGCSNLEKLILPHSLKTIGVMAFVRCEKLKEIKLPKFVQKVDGAFMYWNGKLVNESDYFIYKDEILYNSSMTRLIAYRKMEKQYNKFVAFNRYTSQMTEAIGWTGEHSYDVPVGIVEIACGAFAGKHSLFSVSLPTSVCRIENAAFVCCENLGFINIPSTVSYIGKFAFGKTILKDQIKLEIIKRFGKEVFE
uniref:leucine-rich repeat protein n=1 Tax=Segatella hominis TaxID=2518605 RepID=UPI0040263044